MDAYLLDWVNLLLRWAHVITSIAWIGSSFYFVLLDNSLTAPVHDDLKRKGVDGELWAVHGGGFYHSNKYMVAPKWLPLPENMHWSYWESYSTWLTGFGLFTVLYLFNAATFLVDKSVFDWSPGAAIVAALAFLAVGWLVYDVICRTLGQRRNGDLIVGVCVFVFVVFASWLACQLFAGRAAFLLVGAMLATTMSANVFFWIIPGQRTVVAQLQRRPAGRSDSWPARQATQRPQHLFHAAGAGGDAVEPLRLALPEQAQLAGAGAADARRCPDPAQFRRPPQGPCGRTTDSVGARRRRHDRPRRARVLARALSTVGSCRAGGLTAGHLGGGQVGRRSALRDVPQRAAGKQKNVALHTPELLKQHAQAVYQQSVVLKLMPMNNATQITDDERALIKRWFEAGAPVGH